MRLTLALAVCVLTADRVVAQPAPPSPEPVPAQPAQPQGEVLSETTALWLGLGSTAASWSLFAVGAATHRGGWVAVGAAGTFLTPGAGHLYAGSIDGRGLLLRLASIGFQAAAIGLSGDCEERCSGPALVAGLGLAFYMWGTIDSIATAPAEVRRHNARIQLPSIVPVIQPDHSSVMLVGRF